jgi:hypothetical protein
MAGFINRSKYATILTEDIPGNDNQMRFLADKFVFQLAAGNTDTYTLSNIVGYSANNSVMSIVDSWVGVGTTMPVRLNNVFDVTYNGLTIITANTTAVGINTTLTTNNMAMTVSGNSHFIGSVGIGTYFPKEKMQVYGNLMAFSFKASGGDYSEWELLAPNEVKPEAGTAIGFNEDGKITNKWSQSKTFGIVSEKPSMIGNQDLYDAYPTETKIPIVYLGKIVLRLNETEIGEAGDVLYVKESINDGIQITITHQEDKYKIGYIRKKIEETLYECIIRI